MVKLISNADVDRVLTMQDTLDLMEEAFREFGMGRAVSPPRTHTYMHPPEGTLSYRHKSIIGGVQKFGVFAERVTSHIVGFPEVGGLKRQVKLAPTPGHRYPDLILLFSLASGELLAILQGGSLQRMRVGATSGIGTKYLAREDAKVAGIFGSGWQAETQLQALCAVRPIQQIKVFSPNASHREEFARKMIKTLEREVLAVGEPQSAVKGSDIVITATSSNEPVFQGVWLQAGTHINSIVNNDEGNRRSELDADAYERADVIIVNSREQLVHVKQNDVLGLEEQGKQAEELGDLLIGKAKGRTTPDQITLFKNNVGMGIQFAAVGARVYELATKQGLGRDLPVEWFHQEIPHRN
ncbi:MAG: ornithine cyclodeaminase family protein [Deltaproteobacteria bacterium]|nr:ornithine cyclodeaminase family protein [Deltaproteobacteria bacterium]